MNLLRCHILGFGKLARITLEFGAGLNVVFAPNEGGKSTLQHFLIGMLYGQLRPELKTQRRLEPWAERYKPWDGSDYGGALWCRLAGGRELEILRSFGKEKAGVEIRTSTGEDITRSYDVRRNGEVLFSAAHFGLSKEMFESLAVIRESEVAGMAYPPSLRDRIANLAQSGDERISIASSLEKLQAALDAIGSERAPTKPYKQALDRLDALQEAKRALEARRLECRDWVAERNRLAVEIVRLEQELGTVRLSAAGMRGREACLTVRALEDLDRELRRLRSRSEPIDVKKDFPAHRMDELNRLSADRSSLEKRLADIRRRREETSGRIDQAETECARLSGYEVLHSDDEAEKAITDWFVSYLSLSRRKDDARKEWNEVLRERERLQKAIEGVGPELRSDAVDWQRKAGEAAAEEKMAAQQRSALAGAISNARADLNLKRRRMVLWNVLAGAFLLATVAGAFARDYVGLIPAAFSAVAALVLLSAAFRTRAAVRGAERRIETMEGERVRLGDRERLARREIDEAVRDSGCENVEEFLEAVVQVRRAVQRIADLDIRGEELKQEHDQARAGEENVYRLLGETLGRVGLSCSPGSVKSQIDLLRANLRRFSDLESRRAEWARQIESIRREENEVAEQLVDTTERIGAICQEGGVESPEHFRQACGRWRRGIELREREVSLTREYDRLRGDLSLEAWRERLSELEREKEALARGSVPPGEDPAPVPFPGGIKEAEEEEKRLVSLLASAREEHARLAERVQQAFHQYRSLSEIEEDLALAGGSVETLSGDRRAVTLARETIEELSRLQQEESAPQLNRAVERRFLELCGRRYREVRIDPDFQIWAREAGTERLRPCGSLSRGTQDQLYFSIRFGMLDLLADGREPCPCLLDEPFAAYDRGRLAEALEILQEEAGRRQLFLFTCREDVSERAAGRGARILMVPDADAVAEGRAGA